MTQNAAQNYCQSEYGTYLATIQPYDIPNVESVIQNATDTDLWTGLISFENAESGYIWLDGTEFNVDDIGTNGDLSINLNGNSECASYQSIGSITNEISCDQSLPFLCNKRPKAREYILVSQNLTSHAAQDYCQEVYGTGLATVVTEEEFSDALKLIPVLEEAWIGLRKINGSYVWLDGTSCTETDGNCISYWNAFADPPEPNLPCAWIWHNGAARTEVCNTAPTIDIRHFLCNKPDPFENYTFPSFEFSSTIPMSTESENVSISTTSVETSTTAIQTLINSNIMHCGDDYSYQCEINEYFNCSCPPITTSKPTSGPIEATMKPTLSPLDEGETRSPSRSPTSLLPTEDIGLNVTGTPSPTESTTDEWFIIGVTFIVLFAVVACVLAYFAWIFHRADEKATKGGYHKTDQHDEIEAGNLNTTY